MQTLLRDYPRDTWPGHPNFAASIANWMGAHTMFRNLAQVTREDTEAFADGEIDAARYRQLARHGDALVRNLHGHHSWEDRRNASSPEAERGGRAVRDRAGHAGDRSSGDGRAAGSFHPQGQPDHPAGRSRPGAMAEEARASMTRPAAEAFLARHLTDEDLVVPILLHHKLRG
ncbi:MAG: hemerythrin domain-containing protein [Paracoccaceae bacterium]